VPWDDGVPDRVAEYLVLQNKGGIAAVKDIRWFAAGLCLAFCAGGASAASRTIGIFEGQSDIGGVSPPGATAYGSATGAYTIRSAGAIRSMTDAFHFAWKKVSGDVSLTADVDCSPVTARHTSSNPDRQCVLMFRQSLDANSVYVGAASHASEMTGLQYRRKKGGTTQGIEVNLGAPKKLRLEKRGDTFTLFLSVKGEPLHQVGATMKLDLKGPFYAGIGFASAHAATADKVTFSHVEVQPLEPRAASAKLTLYSTLQTFQIARGVATVIDSRPGVFESPNWAPDGHSLLINENGHFLKIPLLVSPAGETPDKLDTGAAGGCWGEHGYSPDGKWLAVSCSTPGNGGPDVYIVPATGGAARRVTHHPISFFHGWSPDGATIVYTSIRDQHEDIYTVPAAGGSETRLTTAGVNDGAEYTPDGQFIYFNSDRSGSTQIWRMRPDGSQQERVTNDDLNNWYPHISPDGKSMVFLTYDRGVTGIHPLNKDVVLRLMSLPDMKIRVLANLFGGQGTFDSPCWAPDSTRIAFVSNEMRPASEPDPKP
jgi:Tol biopolymer transport system component